MTPPAPEVLDAVAAGPIDASEALDLTQLDRLLDPSPVEAETGWCVLANGVHYAAVRTEMPGVTAEMIDWWFDWHQRDSVRYRIWFPRAHEGTSFDPARTPAPKQHWGAIHYPVEDIGVGMASLRIAFLPPTQLGFSTDALDDPRVGTIVCGLVGDNRRRMQHTVMVHVFLRGEQGLVQRSRFWIGSALRPYAPRVVAEPIGRLINRRFVRERMVPDQTARVMAEHCAAEYANLATLLPEFHGRFAA